MRIIFLGTPEFSVPTLEALHASRHDLIAIVSQPDRTQNRGKKIVLMKVCFMCDLHLPFDGNALQYNILDWAIADIKKKEPDCIVYAGNVTCDGDINVYNEFILKMKAIGIPFFYIPGNSDLRNSESADEIKKMASGCKNIVADSVVYALNDCDMKISDEQLLTIEDADENSIVFMHHPLETHEIKTREKLKAWREKHSGTMLFFGHRLEDYDAYRVHEMYDFLKEKGIKTIDEILG